MSGINAGINGANDPVTGTTGTFSGNATVGGTLAVTGVLTATGGVAGNASTASDPDFLLPSFARYAGLTGITPTFLSRMNFAQGDMRSRGNTSATGVTLAKVSTTHIYERVISGRVGVEFVGAADAFGGADVFDPAAASIIYSEAFSVAATGALRHLIGRRSGGTVRELRLSITATDLLQINIDDGAGYSTALTFGSALSFGSAHIYKAAVQVDRAAQVVRCRLSKLGTGLAGTELSFSAAGIATLTGGTTPLFYAGALGGTLPGDGITCLGVMIATGAQAEGSTRLALDAAGIGFE